MSNKNASHFFEGVDTSSVNDEEQLKLQKKIKKDMTPKQVKVKRFLTSEGAWVILFGYLLFIGFFPILRNFQEIAFVILVLLARYNINKIEYLPFKKRKSSFEKIDLNERSPKDDSPVAPEGITFFGNEIGTRKEVWFTNSDVRTHCLIFGTTGAGKTECLLSVCVNSLNQCSGFIYIDGKGDTSLWTKVFSLVAAYGRLDDLYLVNYMTSSVRQNIKNTEVFSHTMNPFSEADADTLTELLISLLPDSSDGMWKGRASVFISALLKVLVYLRDQGQLLLDIDVIRKHFMLEKVIELSFRTDIPEQYIDGLRQYTVNLPGFKVPTAAKPNPKQDESVGEQHGFITMQFTESFGLLSDTYGKIMRVQLPDIDFFDIVINRRILVVLLPALAKSKQNLGNLGRIIIASIKNMMATTLGSQVEGTKAQILDSKPTKSLSPYLTIFDEFGYYAVENSAVMPAQARSLGFFMIFAGQDFQAFKNGAKDESYSISANCAIKMCMKLEDTSDTYEIFKMAAGEDYFAESSSFEKEDGKTKQSKNTNVVKKNVLDIKDLRKQNAGEATLLFKDKARRLKMFYADPKLSNFYQLNTFVEVEPPSGDEVREMINSQKSLKMNFEKIYKDPKSFSQTINKSIEIFNNNEIESITKLLNNSFREDSSFDRVMKSFVCYLSGIESVDDAIIDEIRGNDDEEINNEVNEELLNNNNFEKDFENIEVDKNSTEMVKRLEKLVKSKSDEIKKLDGNSESIIETLELDYFGISQALTKAEKQISDNIKDKGIDIDNTYVNDKVAELQSKRVILEAVNQTQNTIKDSKDRVNSVDGELDSLIAELLN